jgi:hypothetical protein
LLRVLALCAAVYPSLTLSDALRFTPIAIEPHEYVGGWEHFVGGGVAVFDCDGDPYPEIAVAGGAQPASLFRNMSQTNAVPAFRKEHLTLTGSDKGLQSVTGLYPLDIDSDGLLDLFVLRVGPNLLLKGHGDCTFSEMTDVGFTSGDRWTTAFSATWEENQHFPTLAIGNYVDRTDPEGPFGTCDQNILYRPTGQAYGEPQALVPGRCPLSMLFTDWGRNGRADLRVSNDRHYYIKEGEEQMWAMEPSPRLYTAEDGWASFKLWGMGIASRDVTGDGLPEVYLTSMGDQKFQRLTSDRYGPTYETVRFELGTSAHRPYVGDDGRPSTGWHVSFGDVQNDGWDDIFVAKGNVEQMPGSAMQDPNNLLVQTEAGTFEEVGHLSGVSSFARSRGAALVDLNLDGRLDLVVSNRRAPLEVYQNNTMDTGNWIGLLVRQPDVNTHAVGAWIEVDTGAKVFAREITVGGGHAGGTAGPEHFGLGLAEKIRVRVIWPDGAQSPWQDMDVNRYIELTRVADGFNLSNY